MKQTDLERKENFKNFVSDKAVQQIKTAILSVIACSHQIDEWIDYEQLIKDAISDVQSDIDQVKDLIQFRQE